MEVFNSKRCLGLMEHLALLHLALPCHCNCFPQKKSAFALPFSSQSPFESEWNNFPFPQSLAVFPCLQGSFSSAVSIRHCFFVYVRKGGG